MALNAICELNIRKKLTHRLTRIYNDIYQYDTNRIKYQKPVNHTIYRLLVEFNIHLVGVPGFEPGTPWSQTRCATGLRYTPKKLPAERGGFEPPVQLPVRQFSKLLVSATHPSLHTTLNMRNCPLLYSECKCIKLIDISKTKN